jgi:chitin disaccharide deacetylase
MNLIINADDFGISKNANLTIIRLHEAGIVSSTSIIAAGENFENGIEMLKNNPKIGVGVHLCLDGLFNLGNGYHSIFNNKTNQFYGEYGIINKLRVFNVNECEIYKEYCLQVQKVLDCNIKITHLDSHHHTHIYLPSLRSMIKCAKKFKVPFIRTQRVILRQNIGYFNRFYRYVHHFYIKNRLNSADGLFEPCIRDTYSYDAYYLKLLTLLKANFSTIEVILHPVKWEDPETKFFSSPKVLALIKEQNVISYRDLS